MADPNKTIVYRLLAVAHEANTANLAAFQKSLQDANVRGISQQQAAERRAVQEKMRSEREIVREREKSAREWEAAEKRRNAESLKSQRELDRERDKAAKQREAQAKREDREATQLGKQALRDYEKQRKQEEDAQKKSAREQEAASKKAVESRARIVESSKMAMEGTMQLVRGFVLLSGATEQETQAMMKSVMQAQAFFDVARGGMNVVMGLSRAYDAWRASAVAASAAQAAAGGIGGMGRAAAGVAAGSAVAGAASGGVSAGTAGAGVGAAGAGGIGGAAIPAAMAAAATVLAGKVIAETMRGRGSSPGSLSNWIAEREVGAATWAYRTAGMGPGSDWAFRAAGKMTPFGFLSEVPETARSEQRAANAQTGRDTFLSARQSQEEIARIKLDQESQMRAMRLQLQLTEAPAGASQWHREETQRQRSAAVNQELAAAKSEFDRVSREREAYRRAGSPDTMLQEQQAANQRYLEAIRMARAEKERELAVQQQINQSRTDAARQQADSARQERDALRERYNQIKEENRSAKERFGALNPAEQQQLVLIRQRLRSGEQVQEPFLQQAEGFRGASPELDRLIREQRNRMADAGGAWQSFVGQEAGARESALQSMFQRANREVTVHQQVAVKLEIEGSRLSDAVGDAVRRSLKDEEGLMVGKVQDVLREGMERMIQNLANMRTPAMG